MLVSSARSPDGRRRPPNRHARDPGPPSGPSAASPSLVRRLFTMNGHLLDSAKDLRDKHFYVAAGLETFKSLPYCECPGAAAAQQ